MARRLGLVIESRLAPEARGTDPIPISELVSPLRYDIVMRSSSFSFLSEYRALYDNDPPAFFDLARQHPYFEWFREVTYPRHPRFRANDPETLMRVFEDRVCQSAAMLASFERVGFDPRFPVVVRRSTKTTTTGKSVVRDFYPVDGCHRLGLLMATGTSVLAPANYKVRLGVNRPPLDQTNVALRALRIEPEEYFAFLSTGYGETVFRDGPSLVAWVAAQAPARLRELEQVIAIDRPSLAD